MQDKNEQALTALAREAGNKSCFSCIGPGSLVRASSESSFETEILDARPFSRATSRTRASRGVRARPHESLSRSRPDPRGLVAAFARWAEILSSDVLIRLTDELASAGATLRVRTFRHFRVHEMFGDIQRLQL
jgi:hypothetical protein